MLSISRARNKQVEQPAMRNYLGQTLISMRDNVAYEARWAIMDARASSSISGRRFIVRSGEDGYPQQIFDKQTGAIDHQVAAYWHDHYDLDAILQSDLEHAGAAAAGQTPHLRRLATILTFSTMRFT